jgi:NAD(P)-dependent dehydrogenase (short-subunit alcohol dehydrogenase family)
MNLMGKVAVITGGAQGIGFGMAEAFAARGMTVVLADIEADTAAAAAERLTATGAKAFPLQVDVRDRAGMAAAAEAVLLRFGGADVLCNNAGVAAQGEISQATYADWDWVLGVNLQGVINGLMAFLPQLEARGWAHIVNTSSMMGLVAHPPWGVYATSKFAVVGLSEALRIELAPKGVGVSVLCPGLVATNLLTSQRNRPESEGGSAGVGRHASGVEAIRALGPDDVLEPGAVGELVAEGILANAPYICPHPKNRPQIVERFERILDAF